MDRGELVSRLRLIQKQVDRVHAEARRAGEGEGLVAIQRELDTLSAIVKGQLQELKEAESARELLGRLQAIESEMQTLVRQWDDFRNSVATSAAREVVAEVDAYSGWRRRWGAHTEVAWEHRKRLLERAEEAPATATAGGTRQKSGSTNTALLLELRYSAGLPLTEVARYLGISPAGVQMRIAEFESWMTTEIVREAMVRQLPPGWKVQRPIPPIGPDRARLLLRRGPERSGTQDIVVDSVGVWEDREVGSGRPRGTGRSTTSVERGPRIWAVVFWDDPGVRFVPRNDLPIVLEEPLEELHGRVIELAREQKYTVLTDAVGRVTQA